MTELKEIIEKKYLDRGDFVLSSGQHSSMYFDIKSLFGNLHDTQVLCDAVWASFRGKGVNHFESFSGTELGGAIFAAHLMHSHPRNFEACYIRKSQRIHGLKKMLEGCPRSPILLVDDVISTGKTIIDAYHECVQAGYQVCGVLCVINRWGYDEIVFGRKLTEAEQDKGFIAAGDITLPIFSLFKESDFQ